MLFRLLMAGALVAGLDPNALKLVTATFVLVALLVGPGLPGRTGAAPAESPMGSEAALEIRGLAHTFRRGRDAEIRALQGLAYPAAREFVVVLGTNGSGKSTLLNAVAGSFLPESGSSRSRARTITRWPEHRRARLVGAGRSRIPSAGTAPNMTVAENMALAAQRGRAEPLGARAWAGSGWRDFAAGGRTRHGPRGPARDADRQLSGGQRQALTLLMATVVRPDCCCWTSTPPPRPRRRRQVLRLTQEIVRREGSPRSW